MQEERSRGKKQNLAEESRKMRGEMEEWVLISDEVETRENLLREEHRCGRVGTLYLGKKPRGEKVLVKELNTLHERCEEADYNRFRLKLKMQSRGVKI